MKYQKNSLLIFLAIGALLPFCAVCFFTLPFADDFCFGWTASESISFTQKFLNQYLYWNGRYSADVLVNFHPLVSGKIFWYQVVVLLSLVGTPIILYFFLRSGVSKYIAIIASLLITLLYLNYQPNITEGIYWFIGVSNYHLGNFCLLLHFIFLMHSFSSEKKLKIVFQILSFVLLIFSVGFNEVGALLIPNFYFVICLLNCKTNSANKNFFALLFITALVASGFVFFSPGNFIRANEFPERFNLLHSVIHSSAQTIRFLATWIFNLPFLILSLVVLANAEKIKIKFPLPDYLVLVAAILFVVFIGSFLPYMATGILGQHRTINYVFFFFLLLWVLLLVSFSQKYFVYEKIAWLKSEMQVFALTAISILVMLFSGNSLKIISDWRTDNFSKYETAFFDRQKKILQNPQTVIQPLSIIPKTFQVVDVKADTSFWVDKCMKRYYTETKIELY